MLERALRVALRSLYADHPLRGIGVVLKNSDGQYLILKNTPRPGKMTPLVSVPTGMVEDGEDPKEAAIREVQEETGLHISNLTLLEKFDKVDPTRHNGEPFTTFLYKAEGYSGEAEHREKEKHDWVRWMTLEEIRSLEPKSFSLEHALSYM